jgi:VWFA-related protein
MFKLQRDNFKVRTRKLPVLWLGCILCGLMAFAYPQQRPPQPPPPQQAQAPRQSASTFQVLSNMVVVDVTVRDSKGSLVKGLTKGDFKVYEDNALQEITTFAMEDIAIGQSGVEATPAATPAKPAAPAAPPVAAGAVAALPPTTSAPPATTAAVAPPATAAAAPPATTAAAATATAGSIPPAAAPGKPTNGEIVNLSLTPNIKKDALKGKRLMIMFFDLSSLQTEDVIRSVDNARDFVTKQAGPQDLVAVATYSSALSLVQDLTNDHDVLLKVLNSISSMESGDTSAADLSDASTTDDVYVPDSTSFNMFNTDRRLSAVETLAKMYRDFTELKSLLYYTSGITTTGVENNAQIRSTVDNANRSNMHIYVVDTQGLVAMAPGGNASQASAGGRAMFSGQAMSRQFSNLSSSQDTMTTLAHDTGGKEFTGTNDMSLAVKQVQEDSHVYYVIGYLPINAKEDGRYRKIRVALSRPDLKVEHRTGYFASKAFGQLTQEERDLQLSQALAADVPFSDVPVILQADYFRNDNNTSLVPVSIELEGNALKFDTKGANEEGKFEFVAQVTDLKGRVASVARDNVTVDLPVERAERIKSGGIFYSTGLHLRPGDYKLKFLVRDNATGKLGGFEENLSVPGFDLKSLSISNIILGNQLAAARGGDAASGVAHQGMMRSFQAMGIAYDPLVVGDKKVVPSIGNVFLNRQTVYVYFQVYGAEPDPQSQKPSIETYLMLLKDNVKILESEPQIVQAWTQQRSTPMGGGGGPGGFGGGGGFGGMGGGGPRGGANAPMEDRKGEAPVAISLPLKSLKPGTYWLQIHVHDAIADTNLFQRVPIIIK